MKWFGDNLSMISQIYIEIIIELKEEAVSLIYRNSYMVDILLQIKRRSSKYSIIHMYTRTGLTNTPQNEPPELQFLVTKTAVHLAICHPILGNILILSRM
jgi:hypothetical protein